MKPIGCVLSLAVFAWTSVAEAYGAGENKLTVAMLRSATQTPYYVAAEAGLFKSYGMEVLSVQFSGGTQSLMKLARILLNSFLSCLVIFALASPLFAQVPFTLNFGSLGMDTPELPAWFAKETGIFEKNGLDVRLVYIVGGPTAVMTLISGDTPITHGSHGP